MDLVQRREIDRVLTEDARQLTRKAVSILDRLIHPTNHEAKLLQAVQRGDRAATERFYRLYVRYVTALCSRYITDDEDLKDLIQEIFIKLFTTITHFDYRGEGSLKAWIGRIALNETISYIRQKRRIETVSLEVMPTEEEMPDEELPTEQVPTEVLYRFIRELPEGYRTVFNLFVIEGKSHKEIAQLLGIKVNTSTSQYYKAKALLAQKINDYITSNSI